MVTTDAALMRRLKSLLKEGIARPDQRAQEPKRLASFHRPKFGAKGMAVTLGSLAWHAAHRAVEHANAGNLSDAERELSEAFRRAYWAVAIAPAGAPNTKAPLMLEALVRGVGVATTTGAVKRLLPPDDPSRLYDFSRWALRLADWDQSTSLFDDSPYFVDGSQATNETPPEVVASVMCAWHIQVALRQEGFSPFSFMPYILLPVEVLAWTKRREQLGLPIPALEHPLLTTPTARIPIGPAELAPKGHELIEPLLARCVNEGVLTAEQIARMSE